MSIIPEIKGVLSKWTNYWMGWQPRYFVLTEGILSYYKSEEEASQACKGSVSVFACEINVHPTDNLRLDIVIPGEHHIYVRAASPTERQKWLVALGTSKQQPNRQSLGEVKQDSIKSKRSELRLYSDLLMQQVHSIKEAANEENGPNISKLDESTCLLSATCDTFIKTLDECVKMTNAAVPNSYTQSNPVIAKVRPLNSTSSIDETIKK